MNRPEAGRKPRPIAASLEHGRANPRGISPSMAQILAAAPHRMMFFAGATAVLLSMLWWTLALAAGTWSWAHWPQAPIPTIWAHAMLAQYGMLGPFIFGFTLTVFPRWSGQPELRRGAYVPVFIGVFGGYVLAVIGLLDLRPLLLAGFALLLAGWLYGITRLLGVLRAARSRDHWAWSILAALTLGALGLALFLAFLLGAPGALALAAIRIGTFAFLLPVFFSVIHRMLPFFSNSVIAGYRVVRPTWSLPATWLLLLAHLLLGALDQPRLRALSDALLALLFLGHWIAWQPWKARRPGLLSVLYLAFAWLPLSFALFAVGGLYGEGNYGAWDMAALHALTVGFFGSMLVAMVTRVTHGHSGRPLRMGAIPWFTFLALQAVAIARVVDSLAGYGALAYTLTAAAWVAAFLPWALRAAWIYLTPRRDGRPG
ncbi:MAG: NnrS family protein [Metallibacterium sp.]